MAKIPFFTLIFLCLGCRIGYAQTNQDNNEPLYQYDEQTEEFVETEESREAVDSLLAISWDNRSNDTQKAINAARRGHDLAERLQYEAGIALAHYYMGVMYQRIGVDEQALEHFFMALEIEQEREDKERIGTVFNGIAILHFFQEDYEQSAEYYKKAIALMEEIGNDEVRAIATMNLGLVYYYQEKFEESLTYYEQTLRLLNGPVNNELVKMITYSNLGNSYAELNELVKAENYLLQAIDYFEQKNNLYQLSASYIYLAELYEKSRNIEQAFEFARAGIEKAQSIKNYQYVIKGYKLLSDIYENRNDFQEAYKNFKLYSEARDSMLNSKRIETINEMQARFDVEQKNREIELLNKEAALNEVEVGQQQLVRNFLILGLIFFSAIVGLLYKYNSQRKKANHLLEHKNGEIEKQNEQLVHLNKEKDEFMGMAAHDLRTPLSGIKSVVSMLIDFKDMSEEELRKYYEIIEVSADRMVNLINNLLDVNALKGKAYHLDATPLDVREVVTRSVKTFEKEAEKKDISLEINLQNLKQVMADEEAAQRILENLISNAIKYSPNGSEVEIASQVADRQLEILVRDNGPGIPEEEKDQLFKQYSRLSTQPTNNESSTGLGLFIVKKLAEAMNGTVRCESRFGEGATFIISLPIAAEQIPV